MKHLNRVRSFIVFVKNTDNNRYEAPADSRDFVYETVGFGDEAMNFILIAVLMNVTRRIVKDKLQAETSQ